MRVRIGTFNVENLFARFRFNNDVNWKLAAKDGWTGEDLNFSIAEKDQKRYTAMAIRELNSDILALQEVEGLSILRRFRDNLLGGIENYPYCALIDGNDARHIDVAILSRFPITHLRTWQHLRDPRGGPLFNRDCLEADVHIPGFGPITFYINHFKSMAPPMDSAPCEGRRTTQPIRLLQANTVMDLVRDRFGDDPAGANFIVCGDFNDHLDEDAEQGPSAIRGLVQWGAVENVLARLPPSQRWTHFYRGNERCHFPPAYRQLDYLLPSRALAARAQGLPIIERRGQPGRAALYAGPRFDGVGQDRPKASDHCPFAIDFDL